MGLGFRKNVSDGSFEKGGHNVCIRGALDRSPGCVSPFVLTNKRIINIFALLLCLTEGARGGAEGSRRGEGQNRRPTGAAGKAAGIIQPGLIRATKPLLAFVIFLIESLPICLDSFKF